MTTEPTTELDARFSDPAATAVAWTEACRLLQEAKVFWLSTVRPDRRPHVTPLLSVWLDQALHFVTGPDERKARNIAENRRCILTTGSNRLDEGIDIVVEGEAARVTDDARLGRLAAEWETKYGGDWHFDVRDGSFWNEVGGEGLVFEVAPVTAFGFAKNPYGQTRWRFPG